MRRYYEEQKFNIPSLDGLSEKQVDEHLKLYSGYVKNINMMEEQLEELRKDPERNNILISEIKRRYPFEWNGMRLHEYYFEALGWSGGTPGAVKTKIEKQYGSIEKWEESFKKMGLMRGIGWVVETYDKRSDQLTHIWASDHELGHLAGSTVLIAMDMWEHAYLIDYLPGEKKIYIEAYLKNLNWEVVLKRLSGN